jgi:putative ABC transport system ATP-binding protein
MVLKAENLVKRYIRAGHEFTALNGVSLSADAGEMIVVTGASGSGKSTFLNIVTGLLTPDAGSVILDGGEIMSMSDRELSALRNKKIGYIPQGYSILENLTVLDNVRLPRYLSGARKADDPTARARELLERMGIRQLESQYPSQLSGGELRRVSIARGLINAPRLLVADEPTSDLDPENALAVTRILADTASEGAAVLLVTHETESLNGLPCRWMRMESGTLSVFAGIL